MGDRAARAASSASAARSEPFAGTRARRQAAEDLDRRVHDHQGRADRQAHPHGPRATVDAPPVHRAARGRQHRDAEPGDPPGQLALQHRPPTRHGQPAHPRHRRRQHDARTFRTELLAGTVSASTCRTAVDSSDVVVALSGCVAKGDRVFRCHDGDTRATIKALRDDPNIYNVNVVRRRHQPSAQTGGRSRPARSPSIMQQGRAVDAHRRHLDLPQARQRSGSPAACRSGARAPAAPAQLGHASSRMSPRPRCTVPARLHASITIRWLSAPRE